MIKRLFDIYFRRQMVYNHTHIGRNRGKYYLSAAFNSPFTAFSLRLFAPLKAEEDLTLLSELQTPMLLCLSSPYWTHDYFPFLSLRIHLLTSRLTSAFAREWETKAQRGINCEEWRISWELTLRWYIFFPFFHRIQTDSKGADLLTKRLQEHPAWRKDYCSR